MNREGNLDLVVRREDQNKQFKRILQEIYEIITTSKDSLSELVRNQLW